MPGSKVVAAVEYDIGLTNQRFELFSGDALSQCFDDHFRIDLRQRGFPGKHLGLPDTLVSMQNLPLQIGQINGITVDQRDLADPGRGEIERGRRAESAGTDDQGMCGDNSGLSFDTDFVQQDMPAVTQQLLVVHAANTLLVLPPFGRRVVVVAVQVFFPSVSVGLVLRLFEQSFRSAEIVNLRFLNVVNQRAHHLLQQCSFEMKAFVGQRFFKLLQ